MEMVIALWESHGNGNKTQIANLNGKEWESTAWEWEGMEIKKSICVHL